MTILGKFIKQPADVLDYDFDYRDWATDRSDTIASATATSSSPDLVVLDFLIFDNVVKVFVEGGLDETRYKLTCTAYTQNSRVKQAEISIFVKET